MNFLLSVLLLTGFVACSSTTLTDSEMADVNDIGVVSLFDDKMPIANLGSTVFKNEKIDVNVPKWEVNKVFQAAIAQETKATSRRFKAINFDKVKIQDALNNGDTMRNRLLKQKENQMNSYLLTTAQEQGAKYLWIVRPSAHPYYPEQSGFGLFCRAPVGETGDWEAYISVHAALWDVEKERKIFQKIVGPEIMHAFSGRTCKKIKLFKPEKFADLFKPSVTSLLNASAKLLTDESGLRKK